MTFENFKWAMEAVHSRAFRGDFGGEKGVCMHCVASYNCLCILTILAFIHIDYTMNRKIRKKT